MAGKALGKHYRKGITLIDAVQKFSDEAKAEAWFIESRCPTESEKHLTMLLRPILAQ